MVQCGGTKTIAKTSWKRANPKVWQQFQSDIFTWTLMMVVGVRNYFFFHFQLLNQCQTNPKSSTNKNSNIKAGRYYFMNTW